MTRCEVPFVLMEALIERIKVFLTAAVTWLVVLGGVLTIVISQLAPTLGLDHPVIIWLSAAVVWIGIVVQIIRLSTPVLPSARGMLPTNDPVTHQEMHLQRELDRARSIRQP